MAKTINYKFIGVVILINIIFISYNLAELVQIRRQHRQINKRIAGVKSKRSLPINLNVIPERKPQAVNTVKDKTENIELVKTDSNDLKEHNLNLLGISQGRRAVAFIETRDKRVSNLYGEGDFIGPLKIMKILHDHVVLDNQGKQDILGFNLFNPPPIPFEQLSENERILRRSQLRADSVLGVVNEANMLKITPKQDELTHSIEGLKIANLKKSGLIEAIGIKNNDVISTINGMRIDSIPKVLSLLEQLKSLDLLELGIKRNNVPVNLTYYIRD